MSVTLFNTHAFVKRLTAAGMPEPQAEILADEQVRLIDERLATKTDLANLATKADIQSIKADIEATKTDVEATKADIQSMKADVEATKADIRSMKAEIRETKAEIREVEIKLEAKIEASAANLKVDILHWLVVTQTALAGFIFAVLKFLH